MTAMSAGMALVDAHGGAEAQRMLPLFEGYLEKRVVDNEELYDRVRQAAVVFLGTLARHMEPGSAKVRPSFVSSRWRLDGPVSCPPACDSTRNLERVNQFWLLLRS